MKRRSFVRGLLTVGLSAPLSMQFAFSYDTSASKASNDFKKYNRENFKKYYNHKNGDNTERLQDFINKNDFIFIPKQDSRTIIEGNVIIPSDKVIIIDNDIEQVTNEVDDWSLSHVISNFPVFRILPGSKNIKIFGDGLLYVIYEGLAAEGTLDKKISDIIISISVQGIVRDSAGDYYSKFGGMTFYACESVDASHSQVSFCGIRPSWENNKRKGGGANGFGFYSCDNIKLISSKTYMCGGSGVFTNACNSIYFSEQDNSYNGLSGIQIGAHPKASGGVISSNKNAFNSADGIDIRWVGEGLANINLYIYSNQNYRNGFYFGDLSRPTQDGSGIVTLASVRNVKLFNNVSIESAGAWLYIESCENIYAWNNRGIVYTNKEGLFFTGSKCENIMILNNKVQTNGTSLAFSGGAYFQNISVSGFFSSMKGRAISMGDSSKYEMNNFSGIFSSFLDVYIMGGDWSGSKFVFSTESKLYIGNKSVILNASK
jgi:hypothetical protein